MFGCALYSQIQTRQNTLNCLYVAFIGSKLEYAIIVWDSCTQELSDLIENAHYRAGKIVSGAIRRASKELVYILNLSR